MPVVSKHLTSIHELVLATIAHQEISYRGEIQAQRKSLSEGCESREQNTQVIPVLVQDPKPAKVPSFQTAVQE